jgi:uncharacterized protein YqgC (DUF456 family)
MKFEPEIKMMKNGLKKILGAILIVFGLVSLFIPIFPGVLIILFGVVLLGNHRLIAAMRLVRSKISAWFRSWRRRPKK